MKNTIFFNYNQTYRKVFENRGNIMFNIVDNLPYSRIDLHMHSNCSDGTDNPIALLRKAEALRMQAFAICDHDTIEAIRILRQARPEIFEKTANTLFIPGVELSCFNELGKYHILGLGYDETATSIQNIVEELSVKRKNKLHTRLENIKGQFDITFSDDVIREWDGKHSVGKPHIANELVKMGYAENKQDAIDKYIKPADATYNTRAEANKSIEAIHNAGGVAIWAHPLGGIGSDILFPTEFEKRLKCLIDAGIDGMECYYSLYSSAQQEYLCQIANRYKMLVSCGSDYHGENKNVRIGEIGNNIAIPNFNDFSVLQNL